ncbi:pyridoxamine 5'-phosphate oxidase family protein [Parahaliea mediterranea]|uniref:Pyridoxamine 5'-phosphate oxidase family protein n=1 Tax=Parahaliea mediterranea TaxID=651086 RepID=A0A939DD18_9GAMM|nr:pyridoxamine 5'-phosphate oxidase family protein [Parahaliea mediterranea]MBN7795958.1 pyridoxamine 5'-phosphate oxidase family protein [Parahaliea mediterranea]
MPASPAIPESHRPILETAVIAYVSTIRARDQLISTNPVSFDWDGEALRFSTLKSRMKYRNMKADPRLTVCVMDPVAPTRYIEIRGRALLEDDPGGSLNQKIFRKNMGRDFDLDEPGAERVMVTLVAEQVSTPLLYGGKLDHLGS